LKSTQKCLWYGLMKIWFILGHSKVHHSFLVNVFLTIFLHIYIYIIKYWVPIIYPKWNSCTKMHVYRGTNSKLIHIFQLQKLNIIYLVYICCNFFYKCFLLQVENLNLATNLKFYYYYAMLITWKCMPLYKKLDYNTKNEPPYFATKYQNWSNNT